MHFRVGLIQQLNNVIKHPVFIQSLPSKIVAWSISGFPHGDKKASRVPTLTTATISPLEALAEKQGNFSPPQEVPRKFSLGVIAPNWNTCAFPRQCQESFGLTS